MGVCYGYDGKSGPLSDDFRRKLREQQERLLGDAEAFPAEKERTQPPPKPRIRLKKKS